MEESIEIGLLLAHYGALLTPKQYQLMEAYYFNDLSLQEIAEDEGISRQAVSDQLQRGRAKLRAYEDATHLVMRLLACRRIFSDMASELVLLDPAKESGIWQDLDRLEGILFTEGKEGLEGHV